MRTLLSNALVAVAIVLAVASPSYAQGMSGRGMGGDHHGERDGHHDGHDRDHDGDHDGGRHHFGGGPLVYWNYYPYYYPYYDSSAPGYWYYCPSAEAYYPYVTYCLDPWVPVLAR